MLDKAEISRVEKYLRDKFKMPEITVRPGGGRDAPAEMYVEDEFLAVIYKNIDEGEITFDLTMSILEVDLPVAAPIRPT